VKPFAATKLALTVGGHEDIIGAPGGT
jgi:hypothetical protein